MHGRVGVRHPGHDFHFHVIHLLNWSANCSAFVKLSHSSFNLKCQFVLLKTNAQDFYRLLHYSTWEVFELGSRVNFFSLNLVLIIDLPRLVLCLQLDFVN